MLQRCLALAFMFCATQAQADTAPAPQASPAAALDYDIVINHTPDVLIVNTPGVLSVTITPHAPWLLKTTTPFAVTLQGTAEVDFKQAKFTARDFVNAKSSAKTITTAFTPKEAGEQHVTVDMMFFICSDQVCMRHKEVKDHTLQVNAAP